MCKKEKEAFGPRIIRTLGSQSLSGLNPLSSQPSSISQSPAQVNANSTTLSTASPPGSTSSTSNYRVAQACDRCRSKKTRCDGKRPQCSQCAAVGFECKVSDKLSRRAFPRGYTETLEERVRELEAENRRLVALCDLKDEQLHLVSKYSSNKKPDPAANEDEQMLQQLSSSNGGSLRVSSTNLYLLNKTSPTDGLGVTPHQCDGIGCSHSSHPHLHEKPVSTNLNDPTAISFEQNEAPGLPAVKALSSMANHEYSNQLATLVALSVPRSTEEILFVPQLLARVGQVHGLTSKQCLYTASLLASLKDSPQTNIPSSDALEQMKKKNLWEIDDPMGFFLHSCKFNITSESGNDTLSINEIDELCSLFFVECHSMIPILNEDAFYKYYNKFKENLTSKPDFFHEGSSSFSQRNKAISYKIFACILLVVCQMGLMIKIKQEQLPTTSKLSQIMSYYVGAISSLKSNPYFSVKTTSIQSLQLMSLQLFYFLNIGDISSVYELRGKIVTMAQQLRLHRCPSAVLGTDGSTMSKVEQGERRVLFWGIYYLDVFAALQLGVPRLLKDHEIECALPVSEAEEGHADLGGHAIKLEGQVSKFSLSILRFSKVVGNILDSIFKRGMTASITKQVALIHENALDNWRRGLPKELKFHLDVNGTINMDEFNKVKHWNQDSTTFYSRENTILLALYFLVKCMVHLPVLAARPLNEKTPTPVVDANGHDGADRSSSSYVLLQQATNTLLNVLSSLRSIYLPLAINTPRIKCRFALLSARGSLEYTKGGALFQDNKALLLDIIKELEIDTRLDIPGSLSWHSLKLLDMTLSLILQPPHTKAEKLDKMLQKKLNYYNKLMMNPSNLSSKRRSDDMTSMDPPKLTPISSKSNSPPEKKVKLEKNSNTKHVSIQEHLPTVSEKDHTEISATHHSQHQSSIAEALQLDPVLNSNPFSNGDLSSFFNSEGGVANLSGGASAMNLLNPDGNTLSTPVNDGLFRVPSNGDFLKDYYHIPGASSSQLNLMFMGKGQNTNNAAGSKPQQGGAAIPGFGFAVDASLGLAPLLAWSPDTQQRTGSERVQLQADNSTGLSEPASGPNSYGGRLRSTPVLPSSATEMVRSASIPTRKQQTDLHEPDQHLESTDDTVITMPARSHRGPRRRWNSTGGSAAITPQSERSKPQNPSETDDNLQDLFCWQNSGF
ncbi:LAFE_0G07140g1_1 [Lachancea fermentati]|uniref:LAFE_0G07140g1_1 n=1 Tax=Lachancea fermentati TaxID=4955 RepID=A0A1G4MHF0_LACFM|nr:LAFE_0G07140g1_1 [Lachancea fermentati]